MKNNSLFQIVLLAVFGSLAIAGVLIFAFAVGGGQATTSIGKVVIWGTLDGKAFTTVLDQATQYNQDLQQVTYVQKNETTFERDLLEALAKNTGPDIFVLRSDHAFNEEPKIMPVPYTDLSDVTFKSMFAEAGNVFLGPEGVSAFPFVIDPLVLYWNRDILAGAGYAEAPKFWEDVREMAPHVTIKNGSSEIQTATIALGTYGNIGNAKSILSLLLLQKGVELTVRQNGVLSPALSDGRAGLEKQSGAETLAYYTSFADPSQSHYTWNGALPNARNVFSAGDSALYIGFASEATLISTMNPNLNYAIAPVPQFKDEERTSNFGRVYAFAIPRVASNPAGAFLTAQLLDSATTSHALSRALGIPPARRDLLSEPSQGYGNLFNRMALIARAWIDPNPVQTEYLFRAMIENVASGASSIQESIQRGDQQMAQIIEQSAL